MARRGKGEGAIFQRSDGRWEAQITLEPVNGKRRRKAVYGKTHAEVARKLREAQKRIDDDLPLPDERLTVKAYLLNWLKGKTALAPESYRRYEDHCRLYLIPELGHHKLSKLQPAHLREAYARIAEKLSGTTVHLIHGVLHVALRDAEREGLVGRNVASLVTAPKRTTAEMKCLQPDEARALLVAAKGEPLEAFYTLALSSGLRLGELQALQWRDVDIERRRIHVRRTLAAVKDGEPVFSPSSARKNHERTVWLTDVALDALECHKPDQDAARRKAKEAWREYGLVFTTGIGTPLDGNNVRERHFADLLTKAELPPMRFHNLRHSAASLLLAEGVPVKVVSEMLGHADVATTLRIYAHVIEGAQEQATSVMDRILSG